MTRHNAPHLQIQMSSSRPAASGSAIELEQFSSRCESTKSDGYESAAAFAIAESARQSKSTLVPSDGTNLEKTGSRASNPFDVESVAQAPEDGASSVVNGPDGSLDGVLPQRNVSSLAPSDEGFHAWAFVSTLGLSLLILCIENLGSS